jgi:hypothetical protein
MMGYCSETHSLQFCGGCLTIYVGFFERVILYYVKCFIVGGDLKYLLSPYLKFSNEEIL